MKCAVCGRELKDKYFTIPYTCICLCEKCSEVLPYIIERRVEKKEGE